VADRPVEPFAVAQMVEQYVSSEHRDVGKYANRELLDDSGVYDLHTLASAVYALGFNEGVTTEGWRQNEMRRREREAARQAPTEGSERLAQAFEEGRVAYPSDPNPYEQASAGADS
jgi:hypothetical protein